MNKTRVVEVRSVKVHPLYKKRFIVKKKYYAHDEANVTKAGDTVVIRESRPMSRLKRRVVVTA
jgi:small subunit ribosomal protein S17